MAVMRRGRALGTVVVVAIALQVAPMPAARGAGSSGQLAYSCFRNRGSHVCVANEDGSNERVLGNGSQTFNIGPVWSPDGTQLAYLCSWDRWSGNVLIPTRDIVDFGPVGFVRNSGGEVCVVDAAGGEPRVVTRTNGRANAPVWSPNGKMITYSVSGGSSGAANGIPDLDANGIWVAFVGAPPFAWNRLTEGPGDDMPAWSPDGARFAYSSSSGLWVHEYHTGVNRPLKRAVADERLLGPTWSPDGSMLAYTKYTGRNTRETWVMRADGSKARRLERTEKLELNVGVAYTPSWTPDGKAVIALRIKNSQGQLVALPVSGGKKARSITKPQAVQGAWGALFPAVSSDGTVAFADDREDGRESMSRLAVAGVDGTAERKVDIAGAVDDPEWPLSETDPSWRPSTTPSTGGR